MHVNTRSNSHRIATVRETVVVVVLHMSTNCISELRSKTQSHGFMRMGMLAGTSCSESHHPVSLTTSCDRFVVGVFGCLLHWV